MSALIGKGVCVSEEEVNNFLRTFKTINRVELKRTIGSLGIGKAFVSWDEAYEIFITCSDELTLISILDKLEANQDYLTLKKEYPKVGHYSDEQLKALSDSILRVLTAVN